MRGCMIVQPRALDMGVSSGLKGLRSLRDGLRPSKLKARLSVLGLRVEPAFATLVELVIAGESAFEPGQRCGPDVEAVGCGLEGDVLRLSQNAQGSGVWCRLGVEDLVVDFPGDVAFE